MVLFLAPFNWLLFDNVMIMIRVEIVVFEYDYLIFINAFLDVPSYTMVLFLASFKLIGKLVYI